MKRGRAAAVATAFACAIGLTACAPSLPRDMATPNAQAVQSGHTTSERWARAFDTSSAGDAFVNSQMNVELVTAEEGYLEGAYYTLTTTLRLEVTRAEGLATHVRGLTDSTGSLGGISLDAGETRFEIWCKWLGYDRDEASDYGLGVRVDDGEWQTQYAAEDIGRQLNARMIGETVGLTPLYGDYVFSEERGGYIRKDDAAAKACVIKFSSGGDTLRALYLKTDVLAADNTARISRLVNITFSYAFGSIFVPPEAMPEA